MRKVNHSKQRREQVQILLLSAESGEEGVEFKSCCSESGGERG